MGLNKRPVQLSTSPAIDSPAKLFPSNQDWAAWLERNHTNSAGHASGEMQPAGLSAIEQAKQAGRWDAAYDSPRGAEVPSDLQAALDPNPAAQAFFATLDKQIGMRCFGESKQ